MSNSADTPDTEESMGRPLGGQRLAEARRTHDISIADIAKALHLDESKVQALEENQFEVLGAPVFAKGHLKKYAELVGVSVEDILSDYYQLHRNTTAPPVVGLKPRKSRDIEIGPWLIGAALLIVIGVPLYWWVIRDSAPEATPPAGSLAPYVSDSDDAEAIGGTDETDSATTEQLPDETPDIPLETAPADDMPADNEPLDTAEEESAPEPAEEQQAPPEQAEDEPPAPDTSGEVQLAMTFSGDCWTEVTDANGDRLFFGLGQAGQTITRSGMPPLRALFGDHNNVTVLVNGRDFAVGAGARGNTARVTIDPN